MRWAGKVSRGLVTEGLGNISEELGVHLRGRGEPLVD